MTGTNDGNLIRLEKSDLNLPIYRIYSLERFEIMLSSNRDALVNPTMWEDPFENFFLERTEVKESNLSPPIPLKNLAQDWYGQCWSLNEDTDAMWRIYSPNAKKVGVKVSTTIQRLFDNLKRVGSSAPYLQFFVGKILYQTEKEITSLMENITFTDVAIGGQGYKFANLLCLKRDAFEHEKEIRIIFQDMAHSGEKQGLNGIFRYPLDPNTIFDKVVLDPRLELPEVNKIQQKLNTAGCTLPIQQSLLYQTPKFTIPYQ